MFDKSIIGAVIAENRRAVPLTQAELADRLMVSHQAVSQWERGDTLPDITLIPAIAEALGIDINALFGVKSEPVTLPMFGGKPVADAPEVQEEEPEIIIAQEPEEEPEKTEEPTEPAEPEETKEPDDTEETEESEETDESEEPEESEETDESEEPEEPEEPETTTG